MKLFFEGSSYDRAYLEECFGDIYARISRRNAKGSDSMLDVVGYFFNKKTKDPYFILPKVFAFSSEPNTVLAFGKIPIDSKAAIDVNIATISQQLKKDGWKESIIYELPIWLYRAISKYRKKDDHKRIEQLESLQSLLTPKNERGESTLLDIVLALEDFYRQNSNLYVLVYKRVNSGYNKINWAKTIHKNTPIVDKNSILYPAVANHRKEINFDEQLLCLFYNTLRYISHKFDPELRVDTSYSLTPDAIFSRQTEKGVICKQLRSIKGNYFSDELQKLWSLLYAFHKKIDDMRGGRTFNDFLLIKDFNLVFEDMIDELLSDSDAPADLIEQKDGKILDHIFKYYSLVGDGGLYYVGDSKYYRDGNPPKGPALYKQYTYVKNILQLHFDWYNQGGRKDESIYGIYRDDYTEGYNLSPNFFVSADVFPNDTLMESRLLPDNEINKKLEGKVHNQFPNRLFDRDTLFLRQFDINFLFVLYSYVQHNRWQNKKFKETAKETIRKDFLKFINDKYTFNILEFPEGSDKKVILNTTFKTLLGKVFCPNKELNYLILALENGAKENNEIIEYVDKHYIRNHFMLGESFPSQN